MQSILKNKYIFFILFLILFVTLINLYYKPNISKQDPSFRWIDDLLHPISKSICPLQGFKCPSNTPCDCKKVCSNGNEFVSFHIADQNQRIYVMNKKLTPGFYCLPKGVEKCNTKTSNNVFSLAGWSCLHFNESIFKGDKKQACKNDEAIDNNLNVLWDFLKNAEAEDNVEDYYEPLGNQLRYRCKCGSKSLNNTKMISVFPFICSEDYCLRDIPNPPAFLGWNGKFCECGPYFHLDPNDKKSPCQYEKSRIESNTLIGRVDCMNEKSFIKQPLVCPTQDEKVSFTEYIYKSNDPAEFIDYLINEKNI